MAKWLGGLLLAIGLVGAAIAAAVTIPDVERWHLSSRKGTSYWVDQDWWVAPYSHLRLLGVQWTYQQVKVPSTGEVYTIATAMVEGREVWSIRVRPGA